MGIAIGMPIAAAIAWRISKPLAGAMAGIALLTIFLTESRGPLLASIGSAIVAATERLPAVAFLKGSGVKVGTGVVVDDRLRTTSPYIYAAGDCAELYDEKTGEVRINFGWRSAMKQGRLAGENMAGGKRKFAGDESDYLWILFGPALMDRIR